MKRFKALLRSVTFWLLAGQLATAGSAFLLNIMSAASLQPAERGWLALFLQIGYLVSTLVMLGVEKPYVAARSAEFGRACAEINRLIGPGVWGGFGLLAVISLALIFSDELIAFILGCGALFVLTNVQVKVIRVAYISSRSWKPYVITAFLTQGLTLAGGLCLIWAGVDTLGPWILTYTVAGVAAVVIAVTAIRRAGVRIRNAEFKGAAAVRRQGLRLLPGSLGQTAMVRSDRFIVPVLAGPAALGVYVMAATALELSSWPVKNWCDSRLGGWSVAAREGRLRPVRSTLLGAAVTAGIAGVMSAIVWWVIELFLGAPYQSAKLLLLPLSLVAVVYASVVTMQTALIASNASGRVSILEGIALGVSAVAYLLLVPKLGPAGAAWGTLTGYSSALVVSFAMWGHVNRRAMVA